VWKKHKKALGKVSFSFFLPFVFKESKKFSANFRFSPLKLALLSKQIYRKFFSFNIEVEKR
jgi:hypothetical protein